ncbi:hypothetical protein [Antrihabitans cavernicola]|uniref:Uncharacterized protein n=1 Tax=Antrihabitans cavernicola TaxID=2495913 RepID=A0A5A7SF19_9NOCA|nr:hypothetical protein [Spelaeibacter cavernicola]KAA0024029.1 hypothetical protein FOY51_05510 [Spelaeibacter cavernicola]
MNISRKGGAIADSATKILAKGPQSFIKTDASRFPAKERQAVRALIIDEEEKAAKKSRREPKVWGNDGDIDAILLATQIGAILICNDHPATAVARDSYQLATAFFATILAAEVNDGNMLADEAAEALLEIDDLGIHTGLRAISSMAITQMTVPPGF